eukprot:jgi/Chrzof1/4700/Cz14g23100.t1
MGTALASVGGFCVGHHEVCDHQRLNGQGYCFSASLPPYLATAAIDTLSILQTPRGLALGARLRQNAAALRRALQANLCCFTLLGNDSSLESPVLHLQVKQEVVKSVSHARLQQALQDVQQWLVDAEGLLITVPRYSALEREQPLPGIKLYVSAVFDDRQMSSIADKIKAALLRVQKELNCKK